MFKNCKLFFVLCIPWNRVAAIKEVDLFLIDLRTKIQMYISSGNCENESEVLKQLDYCLNYQEPWGIYEKYTKINIISIFFKCGCMINLKANCSCI